MTQIAPEAQFVDTSIPADEYERWLSDVRGWLPAFLAAGASEQPDPVGDVRELLRLEPDDLRRVQAVHLCLSDEVRAFTQGLPAGLRRPITSSVRPREVAQTVRGPIDWGATIRVRSVTGGDPTVFVTRPGRRIFDTPENQALAWLVRRLGLALRAALANAADTPESFRANGWTRELANLEAALRLARRTEWLKEVEPVRPTAFVRRRLATARRAFYRVVASTVTRLLADESADPGAIAEMISRRYFVPERTWKLFEVWVALRIAQELAKPEYSEGIRRLRLLPGAGGVPGFARFRLHDGDEVRLVYQGWPQSSVPSLRQATAGRHQFHPHPSIPDLVVVRTGLRRDMIVLELKATRQPGYLGQGLSQLLGYLSERRDSFGAAPAGWLVAPASPAFQDAPQAAGEPLWVVSAERVPNAVAARMTSDDSPPE